MNNNTNEIEMKTIGKGGYSVVKLIDRGGVKMARKEIDVSKLPPDEVKSIDEEIKLLSVLRDRSVLIYKENRHDNMNNKYYIYTEYLENGDLFHKIQNRAATKEYFDEKTIRVYVEDIANALKYIHSKGIIHRDLKPANIFIGNHNELIIGDFGIAVKSGDKEVKLIGTAGYIAPELWISNPPSYTASTDIFSFGCILYEIYTFQMAYNGESNTKIRDLILNPNYQIQFNRNPQIFNVEYLITRMLERNPMNRISLDEIFTTIERWKNGIKISMNSSFDNIENLGVTVVNRPQPQPYLQMQQQPLQQNLQQPQPYLQMQQQPLQPQPLLPQQPFPQIQPPPPQQQFQQPVRPNSQAHQRSITPSPAINPPQVVEDNPLGRSLPSSIISNRKSSLPNQNQTNKFMNILNNLNNHQYLSGNLSTPPPPNQIMQTAYYNPNIPPPPPPPYSNNYPFYMNNNQIQFVPPPPPPQQINNNRNQPLMALQPPLPLQPPQQYPPPPPPPPPQCNNDENDDESSDEEEKKKRKHHHKKKRKLSSSSSSSDEEVDKKKKNDDERKKVKKEEKVKPKEKNEKDIMKEVDNRENNVEKTVECEKSKIIQFYIFEEDINGKNVYDYQQNLSIEEYMKYSSYLFPHLNQLSPLFNEEIKKEFVENDIIEENYNLLIDSLINICLKSENMSKSKCIDLLKIVIKSMKDTFNDSKLLDRLNELLENCQIIEERNNQDKNNKSKDKNKEKVKNGRIESKQHKEEENKAIKSNIIKFYCVELEYNKHKLDYYMNLDGKTSQNYFNHDDLYFFFPHLNQIHPPKFTEEERKEFVENEMIKIYYYDLMRVVLIKNGYVVEFEDNSFQQHPNNYSIWKGKEETKRVLEHLRQSIKDTFKENDKINLINKIIQDRIKGTMHVESDVIKFYRGEIRSETGYWFKDYVNMKHEDLRKWYPLNELNWLLPIVDQDNPSFTENDRKIFQNDDLFKYNNKEIIHLILEKYGYDVVENGNDFRINDNYDYWRVRDESLKVLNRIKNSLMVICGIDDLYYSLIEKIINHRNLNITAIKDFILFDRKVNQYSFENIYNMNQYEFNEFYMDEYIPWIFPTKQQNNPKLTEDDIRKMKEFTKRVEKSYGNFLKKLISKYGLKYDEKSKIIKIIVESKYKGNEEKIKQLMGRIKISLNDIDQIELLKIPTAVLRFINEKEGEIYPPPPPSSNPIKSFLLLSSPVCGKTFDEIVNMTQSNFNSFSIDKFIPYLFPEESKITVVDVYQIKGKKSELEKKYKIIINKFLSKYGLKYDEINRRVISTDRSKIEVYKNEIEGIMKRMKSYFEIVEFYSLIDIPDLIISFINGESTDNPPPLNRSVSPVIPNVKIKEFILWYKRVNGYNFEDICKMSEYDFNKLNIEKYIPWIFPTKKQNNPKLTEDDIKEMKKNKSRTIERYNNFLYKFVQKYGLIYDDLNKKIELLDESKYKGNEERIKEIMTKAKDFSQLIKLDDILDIPNSVLEFQKNYKKKPPLSPISKEKNEINIVFQFYDDITPLKIDRNYYKISDLIEMKNVVLHTIDFKEEHYNIIFPKIDQKSPKFTKDDSELFKLDKEKVNKILDLSNKFLSEYNIRFDISGLHHPNIDDLDGQSLHILELITECCIFPENEIKNQLKKLKNNLINSFQPAKKSLSGEDYFKQQIKDYYFGRVEFKKLRINSSCSSIVKNINIIPTKPFFTDSEINEIKNNKECLGRVNETIQKSLKAIGIEIKGFSVDNINTKEFKINFIENENYWIILEKVCDCIKDFYTIPKMKEFTGDLKRKIEELMKNTSKIVIKPDLKTFLEKLNPIFKTI